MCTTYNLDVRTSFTVVRVGDKEAIQRYNLQDNVTCHYTSEGVPRAKLSAFSDTHSQSVLMEFKLVDLI